jgi:hypothetical protein
MGNRVGKGVGKGLWAMVAMLALGIGAARADVRSAREPIELLRLTGTAVSDGDEPAPAMPHHHDGVLRAGMMLSDRLTGGVMVRWSLGRLRLQDDSVPGGGALDRYFGVAVAPSLLYAGENHCIQLASGVGYFGTAFETPALRVLPAAVWCWSPGSTRLLQVGTGAVWRPSSGRFIAYPILGWKQYSHRWDVDVLLPFHARATRWVHPAWGVGAQAMGAILPYHTPLMMAPEITVLAPTGGIRVAYRPRAGVTFGLTGGVSVNAWVIGAAGFSGPMISPMAQVDVAIDTSIRGQSR